MNIELTRFYRLVLDRYNAVRIRDCEGYDTLLSNTKFADLVLVESAMVRVVITANDGQVYVRPSPHGDRVYQDWFASSSVIEAAFGIVLRRAMEQY